MDILHRDDVEERVLSPLPNMSVGLLTRVYTRHVLTAGAALAIAEACAMVVSTTRGRKF